MKMDQETFLTKSKFSKMVLDAVRQKNLSYIDAVVWLCEKNNVDIQDTKKYINPIIKDKLEAEAKQLNMIPGGNTLPLDQGYIMLYNVHSGYKKYTTTYNNIRGIKYVI